MYYAVCNVNGPISVALSGETKEEAIVSFEALDGRAVIDSASVDIEDDLHVEGDGLDEEEFEQLLEAAGAEQIGSLELIVNGHTGDARHLQNGWTLWKA